MLQSAKTCLCWNKSSKSIKSIFLFEANALTAKILFSHTTTVLFGNAFFISNGSSPEISGLVFSSITWYPLLFLPYPLEITAVFELEMFSRQRSLLSMGAVIGSQPLVCMHCSCCFEYRNVELRNLKLTTNS